MPTALAAKNCTPCRGGIPPLTEEEAGGLHAQAPDWRFPDGARRLENDCIMAAKLSRIAAETAPATA